MYYNIVTDSTDILRGHYSAYQTLPRSHQLLPLPSPFPFVLRSSFFSLKFQPLYGSWNRSQPLPPPGPCLCLSFRLEPSSLPLLITPLTLQVPTISLYLPHPDWASTALCRVIVFSSRSHHHHHHPPLLVSG